MALFYPGDPGSGSSQTQNNNFDDIHVGLMCRGNSFKLNSTDSAYQYQTQKIIQNTVRVPASLYTSDLGALSVYQRPSLRTGVNWNQMSDRAVPHIQTNSGSSQGSFYHGSSTRHTQTRCRPGACTPGGAGVDIKHNSYYRYMDRLKAKKDIRRGVIPPTFGIPFPFVPAFPIYGGKTVKTAIVSGCGCPTDYSRTLRDDALIYQAHFNPLMFDTSIVYSVGQFVYARLSNVTPVLKAQIIAIVGAVYTVKFVNDSSVANVSSLQLMPYFPCNCGGSTPVETGAALSNGKIVEFCYVLNAVTGPDYLATIAKLVAPAIGF
jgi:hypothetical protein